METLVLNPSYEPVARISWQRAVMLLWQGKVEEYGQLIRSVTLELKQ